MDKKIELNIDESNKIEEVINSFLIKGVTDNPSKFIAIIGPIASGKTTYRRETYPEDYVLIDSGELFDAFNGDKDNDPERKSEYLMVTGIELVKRSISEKKNIMIEVNIDTDEKRKQLQNITDRMESLGYEIKIEVIDCDLEQCKERNLKGRDNVSSYYSTDETLHYFDIYFFNQ